MEGIVGLLVCPNGGGRRVAPSRRRRIGCSPEPSEGEAGAGEGAGAMVVVGAKVVVGGASRRRAGRGRGGGGIAWLSGARRVPMAVIGPLPGWRRQRLAGRQRLGRQTDPLAHQMAGGDGDRGGDGQPEEREQSPAQPARHDHQPPRLSRSSADDLERDRDHSITARAPRPSLFVMLTEPPHCSTSSRAIGRPSPVPVTPCRPARPR